MADDKTKKGGADRSRININEGHEVSYWTRELGVTKEQLTAAVKAVGTSVTAVRRNLKTVSR